MVRIDEVEIRKDKVISRRLDTSRDRKKKNGKFGHALQQNTQFEDTDENVLKECKISLNMKKLDR